MNQQLYGYMDEQILASVVEIIVKSQVVDIIIIRFYRSHRPYSLRSPYVKSISTPLFSPSPYFSFHVFYMSNIKSN